MVLVASLPVGLSENDLRTSFSPFGRIVDQMVLTNNNLGLVEFDSIDSAQAVVRFASGFQPINVMGKPVRVAFAKQSHITRNQPGGGKASAGASFGSGGGGYHAGDAHSHANASSAPGGRGGQQPSHGAAPSNGRCLLLSISDAVYPITCDIVNAIVSPYGQLNKVVLFEKHGTVQGLLEMATPAQAAELMSTLQGREIYDGCCGISLTYARHQSLEVKENSDRTRDYTNPRLPTTNVSPCGGNHMTSSSSNSNAPASGSAASVGAAAALGMQHAGRVPAGGGGVGAPFLPPGMGGPMNPHLMAAAVTAAAAMHNPLAAAAALGMGMLPPGAMHHQQHQHQQAQRGRQPSYDGGMDAPQQQQHQQPRYYDDRDPHREQHRMGGPSSGGAGVRPRSRSRSRERNQYGGGAASSGGGYGGRDAGLDRQRDGYYGGGGGGDRDGGMERDRRGVPSSSSSSSASGVAGGNAPPPYGGSGGGGRPRDDYGDYGDGGRRGSGAGAAYDDGYDRHRAAPPQQSSGGYGGRDDGSGYGTGAGGPMMRSDGRDGRGLLPPSAAAGSSGGSSNGYRSGPPGSGGGGQYPPHGQQQQGYGSSAPPPGAAGRGGAAAGGGGGYGQYAQPPPPAVAGPRPGSRFGPQVGGPSGAGASASNSSSGSGYGAHHMQQQLQYGGPGSGYGMPPPPHQQQHQMGPGPGRGGPGVEPAYTPVIVMYNIPRSKVKSDQVFNLMCVYGRVVRVKLMNKPADSAMIQMADWPQARDAMEALNKAPCFGGSLTITPSRHMDIQPGIPGVAVGAAIPAQPAADEEDRTKVFLRDFDHSDLQRFKGPGPIKQPFKPNTVVYFGNVPTDVSAERLLAALAEKGAPTPREDVVNGGIEFIPTKDPKKYSGRKSGFLQFRSISDAVECLMLCNNMSIDGVVVKLSFSAKTDINPTAARKAAASGSTSTSAGAGAAAAGSSTESASGGAAGSSASAASSSAEGDAADAAMDGGATSSAAAAAAAGAGAGAEEEAAQSAELADGGSRDAAESSSSMALDQPHQQQQEQEQVHDLEPASDADAAAAAAAAIDELLSGSGDAPAAGGTDDAAGSAVGESVLDM